MKPNFTLESQLLLIYHKKHSHSELVGEMLKRKQTKYIHSTFHVLTENQIILKNMKHTKKANEFLL